MKNILIVLCFSFVLVACENANNQIKYTDTPSEGSITISCDESLRPIMDAELQVFESLYPKAKIKVVYLSEYEAIQYMLKDSARMAIVTRELTEEERNVLKEQKISNARYHKLGYDAVAFIMHPQNKDTSFSLKQINGLLTGQLADWNQINPANKLGKIQVVFDSPKSGAIRLLEDSVLKGSALGKNCFALKNNPEVIDYVQNNPSALGIIGVSWISDTDDVNTKFFLDNINVADVEPVLLRVSGINNKPMQGNIALKQYPYWRLIRAVSREMRTGLGTGFASFMESEPGQKIILKGGLVPFRSSIRTVTLN